MTDEKLAIKIGRLEGQSIEVGKQMTQLQEKVENTHCLIGKMRREILQEVHRMHEVCPVIDEFKKHLCEHEELEKEHRATMGKVIAGVFISFFIGGMAFVWNVILKIAKVKSV